MLTLCWPLRGRVRAGPPSAAVQMTQLKSKEPPVSWKEGEINGNCEFGVKSYLHQFYDGPESVDLDLYEYEVGSAGWGKRSFAIGDAICFLVRHRFPDNIANVDLQKLQVSTFTNERVITFVTNYTSFNMSLTFVTLYCVTHRTKRPSFRNLANVGNIGSNLVAFKLNFLSKYLAQSA